MIPGLWQDPDCEFVARDGHGSEFTRMLASRGENGDLEARLRERDLDLVCGKLREYDFATQWKEETKSVLEDLRDTLLLSPEKGRAKRSELLNIGRNQHWRRLKWHLFELFHFKCAYCETIVTELKDGDVEHYRPKRRVSDNPDHPGYYWLAFSPSNLLPACAGCNRRSKISRFPLVEGSARALHPGEENREHPLLLNPFDDGFDPLTHLHFKPDGEAYGKTPEGLKSKDVYRLNRQGLPRNRREAYKTVWPKWALRIKGDGPDSAVTAYFELDEELRQGRDEYSVARRCELHRQRLVIGTGLLGA